MVVETNVKLSVLDTWLLQLGFLSQFDHCCSWDVIKPLKSVTSRIQYLSTDTGITFGTSQQFMITVSIAVPVINPWWTLMICKPHQPSNGFKSEWTSPQKPCYHQLRTFDCCTQISKDSVWLKSLIITYMCQGKKIIFSVFRVNPWNRRVPGSLGDYLPRWKISGNIRIEHSKA